MSGGDIDGFKLGRSHPGCVAGVAFKVALQFEQVGGFLWREEVLAFGDR